MPCALTRIVVLLVLSSGLTGRLAADVVTLHGKPPFENVQIIDCRGGRLIFRGVSEQVLRKPLDEVACIELAADPRFVSAERAAAGGDLETAIREYQAALAELGHGAAGGRDARPLRPLLDWRLLQTLNRAGRFSDAVEVYVDLLARGEADVPSLRPHPVRPPGASDHAAVRTSLESRLTLPALYNARPALRRLLLELRLYDGVAQSEPSSEPRPSGSGAQEVASANTESRPSGSGAQEVASANTAPRPSGSGTQEVASANTAPRPSGSGAQEVASANTAPRPSGSDAQEVASANTVPRSPTTQPTHTTILGLPLSSTNTAPHNLNVHLTNDSFLLTTAAEALENPARAAWACDLLQRALPHVRPGDESPWRLMLGRAQIAAGRLAEAAALLLELSTTAPDRAIAAAALYHVGVAHERMDRVGIARDIYRELLADERTPQAVRTDAQAALSRLGE